jgi:hypothetical protein
MTTLPYWSYSAYALWKQCPFKAKCRYIDKLKEPDNRATRRGTQVHSELEAFLNWEIEDVPGSGFHFTALLHELRNSGAAAEEAWAFTKDWEAPCSWSDSEAWFRIKMDVSLTTHDTFTVYDFKTGKRRLDHVEQTELAVLAAMKRGIQVERYVAGNLYIDSGDAPEPAVFRPEHEKVLTRKWEIRTLPMLTDTRFEPTQNAYCRSCHFRRSNGGPCKY